MSMNRRKPLPWVLILLLAMLGPLSPLFISPGLAQNQDAPAEVEYASTPKRHAAPDDAGSPAPRASRAAKRSAPPRTVAPPPPVVAEAPAPEPAPVVEELPPWRVIAANWLSPLGINTMLAKVGMTGAPADILGIIILVILISLLLWLLLYFGNNLRQKMVDSANRKRAQEPVEKVEPAADSANLKRNTNSRGGPDRLTSNSRNGPHTRSHAETRQGPNSRLGGLGGNTRSGPDSRLGGLGANTRSGPDSRMGGHTRSLDSRMVPDTQMPDSRMYPGTRGATGMQSEFGDTQFGNSQLGHAGQAGQSTRGHNPVVQKSEVANAPPDFDQPRFLRKARVYFLRLQLAWDKSDLASIRQFAAGPIFNEFRKQILERGDTTNTTDVLAIQTELLGIEINGGNYVASVKFTGMIKETMNPEQAPFEEVWFLSMPREKKGDWVLSGIAQYL
jgi:hypothetical protein